MLFEVVQHHVNRPLTGMNSSAFYHKIYRYTSSKSTHMPSS